MPPVRRSVLAALIAALSAPAKSPKLVPGNSLFSFEKAASNAAVNTSTAPTARPSSSDAPSAAPFPVSYITEKPLTDRAAAAATSAAALRLMSEPQALRVGERRQLKLLR